MLDADVVIIGGGLSGMAAADAARCQGARVHIVDRSSLGLGTNTALANGVFASPTERYSIESYLADTHRIGKEIGQRWMARRVAQDIGKRITWLRRLGLNMVEKNDHYFIRANENDPFPGAHLARHVSAYIREQAGVTVHQGIWVDKIISSEGKVFGVRGFDSQGRPILGQGYALVLDVGLPLLDMEFVQFYPVVVDQKGLPPMMLNSPHPPGSRIVNSVGEDLAVKYEIHDLNDAIRNRRDWFSALLYKEARDGQIFMDYRDVAPHFWGQHPLVLLKNRRFDFHAQPVAISPAAHFFMGGVRIDQNAKTDVENLFACGEICWGMHGACRKGGNALSECLVFGHLAGTNAALQALAAPPRKLANVPPERREKIGGNNHNFSPKDIRRKIQDLAWRCAGVLRRQESLREGLVELERLGPSIGGLPLLTAGDLRARHDLWSMNIVLKAILITSHARQESRGCFLREDFKDQDDIKWKKSSRIQLSKRSNSLFVDHICLDENDKAESE